MRNGAAPGNRALIVLVSLLLVALVGVIVVLLVMLNRKPESLPEETQEASRSVLVNEENVEEVLEEIIPPPVDVPTSYEVSMTMDWVFPDGKSPSSNAYVENVETNSHAVYFDVTLRETGEVIYQSPVIPLGATLRDITLDRELEAGRYSCICEYHLVDDAQETLATVNLGLTVIVEN